MARSALVIAIARYTIFRNLEKTINDASAIAEILEQHGHYAIEPLPRKLDTENENRYELDRDPKKEVKGKDLTAKVKNFLLEQAKGKDALIYFAGHGFVASDEAGDPIGYLAATDSAKDGANALSFDIFTKLVAKSELSSLVVLLDCCNAGDLLESSHYKAMDQAFIKKQNYFLMAACRGSERAREGEEHGIFTSAILDVLRNGITSGTAVNADDLFIKVNKELKQSGQEVIRTATGGSINLLDDRITPRNVPVIEDICPYVGLEAFTEKTARFFKGRDRFVSLLLEELEKSRFVPVIGASGSGKSSLVRAGLIPILEAQGNWLILPPIKPGDSPQQPVNEVIRVLSQMPDRADTKLEIYRSIESGNLEAAIACLSGSEKILLVVDQFEEIFTVCPKEKEAERQQFIDLLVGIMQHTDSRLRVVTTMRADFFENCLAYRGLGEAIQKHKVLLLPMNQAELQQAIEQPAKSAEYELGEGLLPAILRDVRHENNVLPLLEFALTQLWQNRTHRRFTFAAYETLGGVIGALNKHAESIYEKLKPVEQEWAKRICLKLVRAGLEEKDTRQRQSKQELLKLVKDGELQGFEITLQQLVNGRLLATDKDGDREAWVDLTHEALMEQWQRFAEWRDEKREVLRLSNRIDDAFKEWQKAEDKDKFLLSHGVVEQIDDVKTAIFDYLTPAPQQFVESSLYFHKPWRDPSFGIELVDIPAGTFWMGSPDGKGDSDEKPDHKVTIEAFRIGKYPVTQAQWYAIAKSPKVDFELNLSPSVNRGDLLRPVEQVSWYDAREFCARLTQLSHQDGTMLTYRLPTEAEWEYACRAGATDYTEYSFGDEASQLDKYAWYGNNSGEETLDADRLWQEANNNSSQYLQKLRENQNGTHTVGLLPPNAWGLHDMHGNVYEWCLDEWHEDYSAKPNHLNQNGNAAWGELNVDENDNRYRLLRGGSWNDIASNCRSSYRIRDFTRGFGNNVGFRVVVFSSL